MKLYVILIEPEKPVNVGLIARLCENFEVDELRIVNPKLSENDWKIARMFASHAGSRISLAETYDSLSDALSGVEYSIATSSIYRKSGPNISRRAMGLEELFKIVSESKLRNLAVVLGRETSGLRRKEIEACSTLLTIETSRRYRALNIACASSIVLHVIYSARKKEKLRVLAEKKLIDKLIEFFESIAESVLEKDYRRKEITVKAFKNILSRGAPDFREATLLIGVLRKTLEKIRGSG